MALITVRASADIWQGPPLFTVVADGHQIGETYRVTARHPSDRWQEFTIDTGDLFTDAPPTQVAINFINDAGGPDGDRNLYIDWIKVDGHRFDAEVPAFFSGSNGLLETSAALWSNGSIIFDTTPPPVSTGGLSLVGVNFSGAETYGRVPSPDDVAGVDYFYPTLAELDYFIERGMNVFRLAFMWERLQPDQFGALDAGELALIDNFIDHATARGIKVIIDPHNFGSAWGYTIGSPQTSIAAFADFWGRIAAHYADNDNVMFGLMNEPIMPAAQWLEAANAAIAAIRAADAHQTILVPGVEWDGALRWLVTGNASVIGTGVVDPDNNYIFEVHQYLNRDTSGVYGDTVSETIGVDRIAAATQWARATGNKLFLGEVGVNSDAVATTALNNMLAYMAANADVWLGVAYWEAGTSYRHYFTISPVNGVDTPQMDVLEAYGPYVADVLIGDNRNQILAGGKGNDTYYVNKASNLVVELAGEGTDTVLASISYTLSPTAHVEFLALADAASTRGFSLTGNGLDQTLTGNAGANKLNGGGGADVLIGLGGNDTYYIDSPGVRIVEVAGGGTDKALVTVDYTLAADAAVETIEVKTTQGLTVAANDFDNRMVGGTGGDTLAGAGGDDTLVGNAGADALIGGDGADNLDGGSGDDILIGGPGRDVMRGGSGADLFVFNSVADSPRGSAGRDPIRDFQVGHDRIDLSGIDEALAFIGTQAFSRTAGELRATVSGSNTLVAADIDGDGIADLEVMLTGAHALGAGDFLL